MRRTFSVIRSFAPWLLAITFLVISVVAVNNPSVNFDGDLKFKASGVKAEIIVYEGYSDKSIMEVDSENYEEKSKITLTEKQSGDSVKLGDDSGNINFTSVLNIYTIKIEIKNTFASGGRNIGISFDPIYVEDFEVLENIVQKDCCDYEQEDDMFIVSPGKTCTLWFEYNLNTDKSDSFDTSGIEDFYLLSISLERL